MSNHHKLAHTAHDLKQRVLTCLDRLGDRDTQTQATAELDHLARTLPPSAPLLSPFLSCLLSVDSSHKAPVRAHSLRLLSSLASSHGSLLAPHLPKILSSSLLPRLRDPDSSVRSACSLASSSLSRHVTPLSPLLLPLLSPLLVEQDPNAHLGSALCLSSAIESSPNVDPAELRKVLPKLLKLAKTDNFRAKAAVLALIGSVVEADGGAVLNGSALMGGVVGCAIEALSSDDWAARKAAAETLQKVAIAVARRELVVQVKAVCVAALEKRRFDKVKIAREAMNKALEAWKAVTEMCVEDSPVCQSKYLAPKDKNNVICSSPVSSDRQSFGFEIPENKRNLTKSRSSLSDSSTVTGSPDVSAETPQMKKTLSKSRSSVSSFSDDSTVGAVKTGSSQRVSGKKSSSRHVRKAYSRRPLDWKVDIRAQQAEDTLSNMDGGIGFEKSYAEALDSEDYSSGSIGSSTRRTFINSLYEDRGHRSSARRFGTRAAPFQDLDDSGVEDVEAEGVCGNNADVEDVSLIRRQLLQIERQQANLMDLIQTFMGTSYGGINSLEARVCGLEKALNGISHNLGIQGGRIPNESTGNSCCIIRGAEFLSPKFWRKNENGRAGASKPYYSGNMHSAPCKDNSVNTGYTESISPLDSTRDCGMVSEPNLRSRTMIRSTKDTAQRRSCSGRNLDGASPKTGMTPVAQRT